MNAVMSRLQAVLGPRAAMLKSLGVPAFVILVLAMMVLPLPAFALDLLFTFNIAMALMVVMISAMRFEDWVISFIALTAAPTTAPPFSATSRELAASCAASHAPNVVMSSPYTRRTSARNAAGHLPVRYASVRSLGRYPP